MFSLHVAIAFFCFVFLWGEKINSGETTVVWNPATCIKKPLPTWCEEDNNIQFTLQVCVVWHFQFSVRFIYLYVIIHKGLPSLWMCGISLWWIMCTLQFCKTNKSLVITQLHQHLRILHLWCLIPMLKCNDMPLTYILCPLPQLSFVFFSYNSINSLCTDNIFVSNYCFALFCFLCLFFKYL